MTFESLKPAMHNDPVTSGKIETGVYIIQPLGYSVEYGTYDSTIRLDHNPSKRTLTITPNLNREPSEPIEIRLSDQDNEIIGAILQDWDGNL